MNSRILTVFLTFQFLWIGMASGQSPDFNGKTINLGNSPWKFHKIVTAQVNIFKLSKSRIFTYCPTIES